MIEIADLHRMRDAVHAKYLESKEKQREANELERRYKEKIKQYLAESSLENVA